MVHGGDQMNHTVPLVESRVHVAIGLGRVVRHDKINVVETFDLASCGGHIGRDGADIRPRVAIVFTDGTKQS